MDPSNSGICSEEVDLSVADEMGSLPLHRLLDTSSSINDALIMIEKYPAALKHQSMDGDLPLHTECRYQCRSAIIKKCIELYPEALSVTDLDSYFPLHWLLKKSHSAEDDALLMIEKYPAALKTQNNYDYLPIHMECKYQCRSAIITKCIELYPESLSIAEEYGNFPLHRILKHFNSTEEMVLMMIEKYPEALKHKNSFDEFLPLHIECDNRCRPSIIAKFIELYPEALDDKAVSLITQNNNREHFSDYASIFSIIFTTLPMSLYNFESKRDIRKDPNYRRKILSLLSRHVFSQMHEADYADLNWEPRSALLQLLSQIHRQSTR